MKNEVADFLLKKYGKKNPPEVKSGDTVRVHQKIKEGDKERVQIFEGLVIATKHGSSLNGSFTVRKIAAGGIGVERTYPLHSPNIVKVERIKSAEVSRAKLYYMRHRLGKAARFKNEDRAYAVWDEPAQQPAETLAEIEEAGVDEPGKEVVEAPAAAESSPEIAQEVAVEEVAPQEESAEETAATNTPEEAEAAQVEDEAVAQENDGVTEEESAKEAKDDAEKEKAA